MDPLASVLVSSDPESFSGWRAADDAHFGTGSNRSFEFSSASLDTMRESIVEEIVREIVARLQGLDMTEQEMVLTALHGLRAHKADIETEFSSKPMQRFSSPLTA